MRILRRWLPLVLQLLSVAVLGVAVGAAALSRAPDGTSGAFAGAKVNGGTVAFARQEGRRTLTLSADFAIPDAPAPHWQVVDSRGNVHLLQRLVVKGDRFHRSVTVPDYVRDIARVQIWCAWAETLLGEAAFERPVR